MLSKFYRSILEANTHTSYKWILTIKYIYYRLFNKSVADKISILLSIKPVYLSILTKALLRLDGGDYTIFSYLVHKTIEHCLTEFNTDNDTTYVSAFIILSLVDLDMTTRHIDYDNYNVDKLVEEYNIGNYVDTLTPKDMFYRYVTSTTEDKEQSSYKWLYNSYTITSLASIKIAIYYTTVHKFQYYHKKSIDSYRILADIKDSISSLEKYL